ncbi:GT31-family glycosyltransferase [Chara braunii]|uniref:Hexosyltransferase n=1 Tax=Chara braunii TaxID=69332 RepID=A0A388L1G1_CHABU|nr:GT31-family glycosyltransferase [Chara braunii]|eukprot:GBG76088.1 GT31-family glycosyltransferase [Chara braunii]
MRARGPSGCSNFKTLFSLIVTIALCTYVVGRIWHTAKLGLECHRRNGEEPSGPDSSDDSQQPLKEGAAAVRDQRLVHALDSSAMNLEREQRAKDLKTALDNLPVSRDAIRSLQKRITSLEAQLAAARIAQEPAGLNQAEESSPGMAAERPKVFMVVGVNTAFSSRQRRDSLRNTWFPKGEDRERLEREKGVVVRFVIGHSTGAGTLLDRAIEAENAVHKDFMRLEHLEGYHELSAKTKIYFSTAFALWDANFYVKVDDDVHVNLGMLGVTLGAYKNKPRVYIGCMKSGPVLSEKGMKYHEPEFWKFGEEGNKYFRHAGGQIYAISNDLASYIAVNQPILHKYANEDVSLGSWLLGLDVTHVDERSLCCGTPPDCEWKAQSGNVCAASFDWPCSGICKPVERIADVHKRYDSASGGTHDEPKLQQLQMKVE